LIAEEHYLLMESYTRQLFRRGTDMAARHGLLLVDTKYEFGLYQGQVTLIDEIHTPDSSRYYLAEGYESRQIAGERQRQLSKEFVREWLMAYGFQGLHDQLMPTMPDSLVEEISARYIELYEKVTGLTFVPASTEALSERIFQNILRGLEELSDL
jgi:phosphoribosylaminoimidazole-succinocarboxamide synthase